MPFPLKPRFLLRPASTLRKTSNSQYPQNVAQLGHVDEHVHKPRAHNQAVQVDERKVPEQDDSSSSSGGSSMLEERGSGGGMMILKGWVSEDW